MPSNKDPNRCDWCYDVLGQWRSTGPFYATRHFGTNIDGEQLIDYTEHLKFCSEICREVYLFYP